MRSLQNWKPKGILPSRCDAIVFAMHRVAVRAIRHRPLTEHCPARLALVQRVDTGHLGHLGATVDFM